MSVRVVCLLLMLNLLHSYSILYGEHDFPRLIKDIRQMIKRYCCFSVLYFLRFPFCLCSMCSHFQMGEMRAKPKWIPHWLDWLVFFAGMRLFSCVHYIFQVRCHPSIHTHYTGIKLLVITRSNSFLYVSIYIPIQKMCCTYFLLRIYSFWFFESDTHQFLFCYILSSKVSINIHRVFCFVAKKILNILITETIEHLLIAFPSLVSCFHSFFNVIT